MKQADGFTLLETMAVLGIMTILMSMALLNLSKFNLNSSNAANEIASLIKNARAYGMTSTVTVLVKPVSTSKITVTTASTCGATTRTTVPELSLTLPNGATLSSTAWSLCYTSRGLSKESVNIAVSDRSLLKTVQVTLGGGIRVI